MYNQVAFKDRQNRMIAYKFEDNKLFCSNGEVITQSANEFRKRTVKGDNLRVVKITKSNWKSAARIHADKLGYFKSVDTLSAERLDFNNLPQPEVIDEIPYSFINDWLKKERGCF